MDSLEDISKKIKEEMSEKSKQHQEKVIDSQQYQQDIKLFSDLTFDFIDSIRLISIYSTRAKDTYDRYLTIKASDDILQSAIGIRALVLDGIHNMAKRELRYLIELSVKYLIVDQELMRTSIEDKTKYLKENIPNSSIDVIERMRTHFNPTLEKDLKDEITDFYYKSCAYVHPSQRQIEEQLKKYSKGSTIGFESAKELSDITKLVFRAYDMILVILFTGFGQSMSGDLFINVFDENKKWKYHKGKYTSRYSSIFDYKHERKEKHA